MNWVDGMSKAIRYIEDNLTNDIGADEAASQALVSSFYFQKAFSMLCGFTVGEYIRRRRLTLAGSELVSTDARIIDIAVRYRYESPDSFTKAFTRFHGVTPASVRKNGAMIKSFAPIQIHFTLKGGSIMNYKIVEKEAFTVVGVAKRFNMDSAFSDIPKFWREHYQTEKSKTVCGTYGICIEGDDNSKDFAYLIADNYIPWNDVPEGFKAVTIPKHTWAVFLCKGALPGAMQDVNKKIFSEWLPNCRDYEIAGGYNIEMYSNPSDFAKGTEDESYHSEIWIPVKKK